MWIEEQIPLTPPYISFPQWYKTVKAKASSPILLLTALPKHRLEHVIACVHLHRWNFVSSWDHCQNSYLFSNWFCLPQPISRMTANTAICISYSLCFFSFLLHLPALYTILSFTVKQNWKLKPFRGCLLPAWPLPDLWRTVFCLYHHWWSGPSARMWPLPGKAGDFTATAASAVETNHPSPCENKCSKLVSAGTTNFIHTLGRVAFSFAYPPARKPWVGVASGYRSVPRVTGERLRQQLLFSLKPTEVNRNEKFS